MLNNSCVKTTSQNYLLTQKYPIYVIAPPGTLARFKTIPNIHAYATVQINNSQTKNVVKKLITGYQLIYPNGIRRMLLVIALLVIYDSNCRELL